MPLADAVAAGVYTFKFPRGENGANKTRVYSQSLSPAGAAGAVVYRLCVPQDLILV